jgi:CRP/FNR family transcriptional regulator, cyclic AMP receptor protein
VPLFAMLEDEQLDALIAVVRRESIERGASAVAAGDSGSSLYVVISGRFKVVIRDEAGREVILSLLGPREYFGEMVPIVDPPRSATVIAMERCEVLVLGRNEFIQCMAGNFDMTMMVMRGLVKRLREADRKIGSLALMDVYGRVAGQLLEMSELVDGRHVIRRKVAKQDMARMIGASREMVSRVMKHLQSDGYIDVRGEAIYLRDNISLID